ncbi:hypothetical protein F5Y08DRAFT_296409, partial [Xylaria arbuscula]
MAEPTNQLIITRAPSFLDLRGPSGLHRRTYILVFLLVVLLDGVLVVACEAFLAAPSTVSAMRMAGLDFFPTFFFFFFFF